MEPRYRVEDGRSCVDIRVKAMRQLFDSRDPAPFRERDLDEDAAEYIRGSVEEIPSKQPLRIVVWIAEHEVGDLSEAEVSAALSTYFRVDRDAAVRRLKDHVRRAQFTLAIGLTTLAIFLSLSELTRFLGPGYLRDLLGEGFVIIAWVAMWRPVEALLYDWWPHLRGRRLRDRILAAEVHVRYAQDGHPPPR